MDAVWVAVLAFAGGSVGPLQRGRSDRSVMVTVEREGSTLVPTELRERASIRRGRFFPQLNADLCGFPQDWSWGPVARLAPTYLRPFVWAGLLGLASTRIMLLAHYASDVVPGPAIGAALGKTVRKLTE